jgi:predicted DNA-binding helix-hairpin-helix protein
MILRVPGIGVKSAQYIVTSRRYGKLNASHLKKIGVVMKKAQYFITCNELPVYTVNEATPEYVRKILVGPPKKKKDDSQLSIIFLD